MLLLTSVIIGITFVVLSSTPSLANTTPKPIEHRYTTIPKANIAFADTLGADITTTPTTPTPAPLTSDQVEENNQELATTPEPTNSAAQPTPSVSLNADSIFAMVNQIRQQNGLAPFQKDDRLCTLATSRAPEVHNEVLTGTMHHGMYARNLPYWNNENIIDIHTEQEAINFWMSDYVHKAAILGNYQFSCVACYGNACAEEFSNFNPK
jgi:uncharacterized protein YkwD